MSQLRKRTCGVHDGGFHADEVTACALLVVFGRIDREGIFRTRDPGLLASCEFVCDVGGIYDPSTRHFDHHQPSYQGSLSSAGMILLYLKDFHYISSALFHYLKRNLIDGVDQIDNGLYTPPLGIATFSQIISSFLPISHDATRSEMETAFHKALHFTIEYLQRMVERHLYLEKCEVLVKKAMESGGEVLYFDQSIPWIDAFFNLDGENHPALFVLMPAENGHWKLRGIPPTDVRRMEVRKPLPAHWAGLADSQLAQATGIPGAIFCHKGLFVSFWKSRQDALAALGQVLGRK